MKVRRMNNMEALQLLDRFVRLYFGDVKVMVDASWDDTYKVDFCADYRARFEKATVYYDGNKITVYPNEGDAFTPKLPGNDAYTEEIRQFAAIISDSGAVANPNPATYKHEARRSDCRKCGERRRIY